MKPDVFLDEELWALIEANPELHLLQSFEGLWCQADRDGRFEWRASMLKTQILPYWDGDFGRALDVLRASGFIRRYEVGGRYYGEVRSFHRHQRPNNREPESVIPRPLERAEAGVLEHAEGGGLSVHEPRASAPRASLLPTPTPNPYSQPQPREGDGDSSPQSSPVITRVVATSGVPRVTTMPSEAPPQEFLDAAVMGGVSLEQARSTWKHYWGAGLPERGVERLHPWLVQRAKERSNQQAGVTPTWPEGKRKHGSAQPNAGLTGFEWAPKEGSKQ